MKWFMDHPCAHLGLHHKLSVNYQSDFSTVILLNRVVHIYFIEKASWPEFKDYLVAETNSNWVVLMENHYRILISNRAVQIQGVVNRENYFKWGGPHRPVENTQETGLHGLCTNTNYHFLDLN
jgi:hypothetical protein